MKKNHQTQFSFVTNECWPLGVFTEALCLFHVPCKVAQVNKLEAVA
jgi:hypothetical protein